MNTQIYKDALIYKINMEEKNNYLFSDVFGAMKVLNCSSDSTMFNVKTYDKHPTFKEYIKDPNVAFETGTANSSRFGKRTEVKYSEVPIKFTFDTAADHGIDKATVNTDPTEAIKDITLSTWNSFNRKANLHLAEGIIKSAKAPAKTIEDILEIFRLAKKVYAGSLYNFTGVAYVSADAYAAIVEHPKTTILKHSTANIDCGEILSFYGFKVILAEGFLNGQDIVFAPINMGIYAVDIKTARLIEPESFDGYAYQMHVRGGYFLPQTDAFKELIILGKLKAQTPPTKAIK